MTSEEDQVEAVKAAGDSSTRKPSKRTAKCVTVSEKPFKYFNSDWAKVKMLFCPPPLDPEQL